MHPILQPLHHADLDTRFEAADALAEQFERGQVPGKAYKEVIAGLIELAAAATDAEWQEAVLNTLNHAMIRYTGDPKVFEWPLLIAKLKEMAPAPLSEALPILSLSGLPNVRDLLTPFLKHSSERVREAADFALDELDMTAL